MECQIPRSSVLSNRDSDFSDAYFATAKGSGYSHKDIARAFMLSPPTWVGSLFTFRNTLAKMIGLKTPGDDHGSFLASLDKSKLDIGDQFGLFKVFEKTDSEVVLGEDDSHLDFRVSLHQAGIGSDTQVTISTIVVFNNWIGRAYFLPVRFFHKIITKSMLKRTVQILENGS